MSTNPRWRRKLAFQICAGALAAGAGYYGEDILSLSLSLSVFLVYPFPPGPENLFRIENCDIIVVLGSENKIVPVWLKTKRIGIE